jgi:two-component sensor histidine kinase
MTPGLPPNIGAISW